MYGCSSSGCEPNPLYDPDVPTNNGFDGQASTGYKIVPQLLRHLPQGFTIQSDAYCANNAQAGSLAEQFDPHSMICTTAVTPNTGDCQVMTALFHPPRSCHAAL